MTTKIKWRRNSDEGSYLTEQHGMVIQGVGKRVRLSKSAPWNWEVDYKGERIRGTAETCRDAKSAVESYLEPKETIVKTRTPSVKFNPAVRDRLTLAIVAEFKHFVQEIQQYYDAHPLTGHHDRGMQTAPIDLEWCISKAWTLLVNQHGADHPALDTNRAAKFVESVGKAAFARYHEWCKHGHAQEQAVSHYWKARKVKLEALRKWIDQAIATPCDSGYGDRNSVISALVNTVDTAIEHKQTGELPRLQDDREVWILDFLLAHR